jgi:ABC-type branched-subunit amino acid transport system substrate-binding protein
VVTKARWCVPFLVVALLAVGCSRSGGSSKGGTTTTTVAKIGSGDFGDVKAVCGPGTAKGATSLGVTDTEIRVGTMADPGTPVQPGLDQELFDSAAAFVGWCNDAGGINGRKLSLDKWDAKLTETATRMIQACQVDFFLVGNGEAFDSAGVGPRTQCGLPEIAAYDVSKQAGRAPLSIMALPGSDHQSPMGGALRVLKEIDPTVLPHLGQVSSTLQSVKDAGDRDRAAAKILGYTHAYYDEAPIIPDTWRPYATNLQTKGVQAWMFENAPFNLAAFYRELHNIGYIPKYGLFAGNMYDDKLTKTAGPALAGNVLITTAQVPFELASTHPATKQYIDILAKYVSGASPKSLGINAWSSWLLWAKSVKACGSNVTRQCVFDGAKATKGWTAGGVHAASNPNNLSGSGNECFLFVRATPTGFVYDQQMTRPNRDIFNCDPRNAFDLPGFP